LEFYVLKYKSIFSLIEIGLRIIQPLRCTFSRNIYSYRTWSFIIL